MGKNVYPNGGSALSIICHQMEGENVLYMREGNKETYLAKGVQGDWPGEGMVELISKGFW